MEHRHHTLAEEVRVEAGPWRRAELQVAEESAPRTLGLALPWVGHEWLREDLERGPGS